MIVRQNRTQARQWEREIRDRLPRLTKERRRELAQEKRKRTMKKKRASRPKPPKRVWPKRHTIVVSSSHFALVQAYGKGSAIAGMRALIEDFEAQISARLGRITREKQDEDADAVIFELTGGAYSQNTEENTQAHQRLSERTK